MPNGSRPALVQRDLTLTVLSVLLLLMLIGGSLWILRPFLLASMWAMMIVVATWPIMLAVQARVRRRAVAVGLMSLGMVLVFVAPLVLAIETLLRNMEGVTRWLRTLPLAHIPLPPAWVADVPLVGARVAERWSELATAGKDALAARLSPYATDAAQWLAGAFGSFGMLLVQFLLTVIVAVVLYSRGEAARDALLRLGRCLAGERGEAAVVLAGQSIRAVALGVVVTALAQTALTGVGLFVAGVPFAGLLTGIVLLLCIAQIGPVLVLVPAIAWLFWTGSTTAGAALLVWAILVAPLDNVLRPLLIRRGADLPLLLVFSGVIGGLIAFGIVGLFIGPVVLAISFTMLKEWMNERDRRGDATGARGEPAKTAPTEDAGFGQAAAAD